jgi:hypothetical protein
VDTFVFICDSEDAAFTDDGYSLDAREARELADELSSREPEWASCGRVQLKWVATVCAPSPIVSNPDASFGCRLRSI